jgi:hypothetical protein
MLVFIPSWGETVDDPLKSEPDAPQNNLLSLINAFVLVLFLLGKGLEVLATLQLR